MAGMEKIYDDLMIINLYLIHLMDLMWWYKCVILFVG